jgi:membrane-associated protein
MPAIGDILDRLRDLPALVQWAGYVGLFAIIFTETGLFFGFFLPGDSLLVTAGLLIATRPEFSQALDVGTLGTLLTAAAILGDNTNYWVGRSPARASSPRRTRSSSSGSTCGRPRSSTPGTAPRRWSLRDSCPWSGRSRRSSPGAAHMPYRTFVTYSVTGGFAWIWSMLLLGYFLGSRVPGVAKYLELVIIA